MNFFFFWQFDSRQFIDKFLQRCQLPFIDQFELLDEKYEMLEASVEMGLFCELNDLLEMLVIDVGVHAK